MTNTSQTPNTVEKLVRNFRENDKDMIGDLGITLLAPRKAVVVNDTVEVNICEDTTFTNTTGFIMNEPSNVITCIDTAK